MPLSSTHIIKLTGFPPTLPNVPPNYPLGPAPDKIRLLLNANDTYLYHKFSPFTNYHDSLLSGILSNKQPFVYTFVDEGQKSFFKQLPASVKGMAEIAKITPDTVKDVVRVSKFLISSWGVQFLITQAAIQRLAPFDETRVYNPLSPILATVQPMTLGIGNRPVRHIEGEGLLGLGKGLLGSITSAIGINLQSGFNTPSSTAGDRALPSENIGQGKGLIRGGDAGKGLAQIQMKWPVSVGTPGAGGFLSGLKALGTAMANAAGQMFGITKIRQPSDTNVRADEGTYLYMATSYKLPKQSWYPISKTSVVGGPPTAKSSPLSKLLKLNPIQAIASVGFAAVDKFLGLGGGKVGQRRIKLIPQPDGRFTEQIISSGFFGGTINNQPTGYSIEDGDRYGDNVGPLLPTDDDGDFSHSDVLVQYSYYIQDGKNFPTKFSDGAKSDELNKQLKKVINKINSNPIYSVQSDRFSYLLPGGSDESTFVGYDSWTKKNKVVVGAAEEYRFGSAARLDSLPKTIDISVKPNPNNLRMATSFFSDGMNTLGVLGGDRKVTSANSSTPPYYMDYWQYSGWRPYEDDLIAFYFYDVVNDKYIPFRATVKAISEGAAAYWDELRFIGRSDQVYSYNGFSRTLSFSFNIVINSVIELLPSWKKINYIASSVKPSNYTTGPHLNQFKFNRFIVPPMFMLTIGDLYKFQPIVITSVNVNIPEDAAWETLNEDNSKSGWNYMNGLITSPNVGKNYGQLPREAEISITCNLLEKERAIVGGSHFGHQPRMDDWEERTGTDRFQFNGRFDFLPPITELHRGFVEWNTAGVTPARKSIADKREETARGTGESFGSPIGK